jgi:DNA-binding SARP family transcriptional activator/Cdc6-like AAA superfamily ATPase
LLAGEKHVVDNILVAPIRIELLGKLRLTIGQHLVTTVSTNRMQSLLAFVALHGAAPQSREHLAFLLWPESSESQARTNLRQLLHNLRRALPGDCSLMASDHQTVRWSPDGACAIDVIEFETAVDRAAQAEKKNDLATARDELEKASQLYQDDLLPGLYDEWIQTKRERLRRQFTDVLSRLAELHEMSANYSVAIQHAARLVALDPLRENACQLLMRLHVASNDRSSALRVYHQCMRTLQRELGVTPSKATQDLFAQALKSEPKQQPPEPQATTPPAPLAMVGRKAEWEGLLQCWRQVARGGIHFALIAGDAGIGKTRLSEELVQHCSRSENGTVAIAHCYFGQGQLAYGPVAEWLRTAPLRQPRMRLPKPQLTELARVLPEILVDHPDLAPPQPLTESWQRRHFYEALNAVFRNAAKPLLLLIEDLHWCDHDSFEWLHALFKSDASERIFVVGTARAEETGRDHPLARLVIALRQSGQILEFPLSALNVEETSVLAGQIANQRFDGTFLSNLYQSTKGNPLFVVESVRASQGDPGSTNLAPRIQAVIAARLAQLSPPAYELAGLAATIGRPFSFDLLAKATDWDEDGLSRALEELWRRRIIEGHDDGTYDYTHDLLRQVAYAELSPIRRRSWHKRVARGLEELHPAEPERISGLLAAHYESAGMAEEAIRHFRAAAEIAKQRFAYAEAEDLVRRAMVLCRAFPETARRDQEELNLLIAIGPTLFTTRGYSAPEVGEIYERALLLSRRSGDQKHLFSVLSGCWLFHIVRARLQEARSFGEQCIESSSREGDPVLTKAGHFLVGSSMFQLGEFAASLEHLKASVPPYGSPSHPALAVFAGPDFGVFSRSCLAHVLLQKGDEASAVAQSQEAIALAHELAHPFSLAIALDYAAMLNVFREDHRQALTLAEEASGVCQKHGFAYYHAWAEILAGWAAVVEEPSGAELARLRQGLEDLRATGAELRLPFYYALLAEACSSLGQTGEALAHLATAFAFEGKNGEVWSAPELHRIQGDVLCRGGDLAQAEASYRRAVEVATEMNARYFAMRSAARLRQVAAA